jgi:hypothetical protein
MTLLPFNCCRTLLLGSSHCCWHGSAVVKIKEKELILKSWYQHNGIISKSWCIEITQRENISTTTIRSPQKRKKKEKKTSHDANPIGYYWLFHTKMDRYPDVWTQKKREREKKVSNWDNFSNVPVGERHLRSEDRNKQFLTKWIPGVGRRHWAHPGQSSPPNKIRKKQKTTNQFNN